MTYIQDEAIRESQARILLSGMRLALKAHKEGERFALETFRPWLRHTEPCEGICTCGLRAVLTIIEADPEVPS